MFKGILLATLAFLIMTVSPSSMGEVAAANSAIVTERRTVPDVSLDVDWEDILRQYDIPYDSLPTRPLDGPMIGNGLSGTYLIQDPGTGDIRFEMSREDLYDVRTNFYKRKTNGYFNLSFQTGKPTGSCELNIWDAQIVASLSTGNNSALGLTAFADAETNTIVFKITQHGMGAEYVWKFVPDNRGWAGPVKDYDPAKYIPYPAPMEETCKGCNVITQDMPVDAVYKTQTEPAPSQHATAWRIVKQGATSYIYTSVGYSFRASTAKQEAVDNVNAAVEKGFEVIQNAHRKWWHDYYQKSFVSMPERFNRFHWMQLYKIASMTRGNAKVMIHLLGPWFDRNVVWNGIWLDWNSEKMYLSVDTANHPEISASITHFLYANRDKLSSGNGRYSLGWAIGVTQPSFAADCSGTTLPYLLSNCWDSFEATQDLELLRTELFPLLVGAYRQLRAILVAGNDGKLHIPNGASPEYSRDGKHVFDDSTFSLGAIRWVCATIIKASSRYGLEPTVAAECQATLNDLAPYHIDPNEGFMVGKGEPFKIAHITDSHEHPILPYLEYTPDDPKQAQVTVNTLDTHKRVGYGTHGMAQSTWGRMHAMLGNGNQALRSITDNSGTLGDNFPHMSKKTTRLSFGNGGYCEEVPFLAARVVEDMLLQSYNGVIRVFPAVPDDDNWDNLAFHDFRARGAFLVSAQRVEKQTRFVKIKSLAGEACNVRTSMPGTLKIASNYGNTLTDLGNGIVRINDLHVGEWCILYAGDSIPDLTIRSSAKKLAPLDKTIVQNSADGGKSNDETASSLMLDLTGTRAITSMRIYGRSDQENGLENCTVSILDANKNVVWSRGWADYTSPCVIIKEISKTGRYVKVWSNENHSINITDVQVFGSKTVNVALGKTAAQSSTIANGVASRAIDGDTDGDFGHGSVTHTNSEKNAWWELDLGNNYAIEQILVHNRKDSADRLSNYTVYVLDEKESVLWSESRAAPPSPSTAFLNIGKTGRYVRVQLDGTNFLSLAEVQVLGEDTPIPSR